MTGHSDIRARLIQANERFQNTVDRSLLQDTAENGQHPYAIVICCSDSRVVPEQIFDAAIGDLFVVRVAGNVLDRHQLGSIEYAAEHLHCSHIIVLGHTGCGAVQAALAGGGDGFIRSITDEIQRAIGGEKNPDRACCLNVAYAVRLLQREFAAHPEVGSATVGGAVYDIRTGAVRWLQELPDR